MHHQCISASVLATVTIAVAVLFTSILCQAGATSPNLELLGKTLNESMGRRLAYYITFSEQALPIVLPFL